VKRHRGAGVLLLVDMGSLKVLGEQIQEETGIKIRVLELVSTITVLECAIKAQVEKDIDNIWYTVNENNLKFYQTNLESS
jgi:transcriptional regulatory protein LevR